MQRRELNTERDYQAREKEITCRRTVLFDEWKNINKTYHKREVCIGWKRGEEWAFTAASCWEVLWRRQSYLKKKDMMFERWIPDIRIEGELENCPVTQDLTPTAVFI